MDAIAFAASYATVSACASLPLALTVDPATVTASWVNWLAVLGLGLGSSGLPSCCSLTRPQQSFARQRVCYDG